MSKASTVTKEIAERAAARAIAAAVAARRPRTAAEEVLAAALERRSPSEIYSAIGNWTKEQLEAYRDRCQFEERILGALAAHCPDRHRPIRDQVTKEFAEDIEEAVIDELAKKWAEEMAEEES